MSNGSAALVIEFGVTPVFKACQTDVHGVPNSYSNSYTDSFRTDESHKQRESDPPPDNDD